MAAAYAALLSLENLIHDIQNHPFPPVSLDKRLLNLITQHITFFQEFLHAYNPPLDEEVADPLEMRIANAAYAAEDAIEYHIVDTTQQHLQRSNDENIKSINLCCDSLQLVIQQMDSIKKAVVRKVDTEDNNNKVPLVVHDQVATANILASVAHDGTMVGSNDLLLDIMEKLTGGRSHCQVIPIDGMSGIGKTFLTKTIYTAPLIKDHFDICAWATISQQYNARAILCEVLSQANPNIKKEQLNGKSEDGLGSELHKYLFGRRFLIVLDDMWSIDPWDKIQRFFPNNQNGSRILVTTRLSQLSSQLNNNYCPHINFLGKASSWDLFSKTVFGDRGCPRELKKIGEKIVEHCRGLPLSIVVIGGLLKKMDANQASWESIQHNFSSVVNMDNNSHCLRLLKMSYNHLPVYLKPCFLYMGVFEEDVAIRVGTLVKLWVSEGFLKPSNTETLETTARGFLQELIDRNLITIDRLGSTGGIKYCKMHDLLRDLCLKEGQKTSFYHVMGQCNPPPPPPPTQGMNTQRRVIIPMYTLNEKVCNELRSMSHARSIIYQYETRRKVLPFGNMRLLRVLHEYYDESDVKSLVLGLVNIRHLTTFKIYEGYSFLLPPLVSQSWNLHTLKVDFFPAATVMFPADFWKMSQFKHIEFINCSINLPDPPRDADAVVIMKNLHTLKGVRNFKCCEEVVKRIPNIKKLDFSYHSNNEGDRYFVGNIKSLCRLESLTSWCDNICMKNYKLTFPRSLKKLTLWMNNEFEWEDMLEKIGSLLLLEKLKLSNGCFRKGEWKTVEGQFPKLKYLGLYYCRSLKNWTAAEEGSDILLRLENLCIYYLDELEKIPCELGNIDTLRRIRMFHCGEGAVKSLKEMVDEQVESQGEEQLSFHVVVDLREQDKHLLSLSGPNFGVTYSYNYTALEEATMKTWINMQKIKVNDFFGRLRWKLQQIFA